MYAYSPSGAPRTGITSLTASPRLGSDQGRRLGADSQVSALAGSGPRGRSGAWWSLAILIALAAALRLSTLSGQSLWFDEAYTPVHDLHASLWPTLSSIAQHENTPPLWYVLIWGVSRLFGTGVVALRLPSALCGVALVAVGWRIGVELGSRRVAVIFAALLATNPLFAWYSQEARAYELYALLSGLSILYFVRAYRRPSVRALTFWSISAVLALLCEYFAVFLVGVSAVLLLSRAGAGPRAGSAARVTRQPLAATLAVGLRRRAGTGRATVMAVAAVVACGGALVPLALAQGGRGTQWIGHGHWPAGSSRSATTTSPATTAPCSGAGCCCSSRCRCCSRRPMPACA